MRRSGQPHLAHAVIATCRLQRSTTAPATPVVFSHGTAPNRNLDFRTMARSASPDPSFGSCRAGVPRDARTSATTKRQAGARPRPAGRDPPSRTPVPLSPRLPVDANGAAGAARARTDRASERMPPRGTAWSERRARPAACAARPVRAAVRGSSARACPQPATGDPCHRIRRDGPPAAGARPPHRRTAIPAARDGSGRSPLETRSFLGIRDDLRHRHRVDTRRSPPPAPCRLSPQQHSRRLPRQFRRRGGLALLEQRPESGGVPVSRRDARGRSRGVLREIEPRPRPGSG